MKFLITFLYTFIAAVSVGQAQSNGVQLSWGARQPIHPSRSDESLRQEGMMRAAYMEDLQDEFWKWALLARDAEGAGDCDKCIYYWEMANGTIPNYQLGKFHYIGGRCYEKCANYRKAKQCYRRAIELGEYDAKLALKEMNIRR